jgi:small GTP-binding protein
MASPRQLRLALCGDANVGKTSLFLRFSKGDDITEREIEETAVRMRSVGSDECTKTFSARGKELRVSLNDTGGQEQHQLNLTGSVYQHAQAILFVCSVDDEDSLMSLNNWLREAKKFTAVDAQYYIIGNKIDLKPSVNETDDNKFISHQRLADFVAGNRSMYPIKGMFKTSALKGTNVKEMFDEIADDLAATALPEQMTLPIDQVPRRRGCCK